MPMPSVPMFIRENVSVLYDLVAWASDDKAKPVKPAPDNATVLAPLVAVTVLALVEVDVTLIVDVAVAEELDEATAAPELSAGAGIAIAVVKTTATVWTVEICAAGMEDKPGTNAATPIVEVKTGGAEVSITILLFAAGMLTTVMLSLVVVAVLELV